MPTLVIRRRDCGKEGKRDRKTAISGGDGVELWPRKLATAKFLIEDMKNVKRAVSSVKS